MLTMQSRYWRNGVWYRNANDVPRKTCIALGYRSAASAGPVEFSKRNARDSETRPRTVNACLGTPISTYYPALHAPKKTVLLQTNKSRWKRSTTVRSSCPPTNRVSPAADSSLTGTTYNTSSAGTTPHRTDKKDDKRLNKVEPPVRITKSFDTPHKTNLRKIALRTPTPRSSGSIRKTEANHGA